MALVLAGPACVRQPARPDKEPAAPQAEAAAPASEAGAACDIASRYQSAENQYSEDEDGDEALADGVLGDIAELDEALAAMEDGADHAKKDEDESDLSALDARMQLVNTAISKLGTRYRRGGTSVNGFDCSGFTGWVFDNVGIDLPRTSQSQFLEGRSIRKDNLQTGDLVFFKRGKKRRIHHVGIYLEDGKFIHSSTSDGVVISSLSAKPWSSQWAGAKRVF